MTKYLILIFTLCAWYSCKETSVTPGTAVNPPKYEKSDLKKLRWIEGNWKTDLQSTGYYQAFHFPTDSTLEIVSYQFNGQDTSSTSTSTLYWRNDHLYMGPNQEWVAVLLDKKNIQLDPVRPGWHSIYWTQNSDQEWTMVHKKPDLTRTLKMKKQPAIKDLLKK